MIISICPFTVKLEGLEPSTRLVHIYLENVNTIDSNLPMTLPTELQEHEVPGRIELPSTGWKPVILPLNYARNILLFCFKRGFGVWLYFGSPFFGSVPHFLNTTTLRPLLNCHSFATSGSIQNLGHNINLATDPYRR